MSQGVHPQRGVKQVRDGENKLFSSKVRQYHSPDGADGCCITSNKSLTCLQLVFTSNWSNFRHAFASRRFVSVIWAFLLLTWLHVTDPSLSPARAHGTSCRSAYAILGYHRLLSIWRLAYCLLRFETTAHLWHLWFLCAVCVLTCSNLHVLTYLDYTYVSNTACIAFDGLSLISRKFGLETEPRTCSHQTLRCGMSVLSVMRRFSLATVALRDELNWSRCLTAGSWHLPASCRTTITWTLSTGRRELVLSCDDVLVALVGIGSETNRNGSSLSLWRPQPGQTRVDLCTIVTWHDMIRTWWWQLVSTQIVQKKLVMHSLFLKPITHLEGFFRNFRKKPSSCVIGSKVTFERKLSDVAYTLAQVFSYLQTSTFRNRTSSTPDSLLSQTVSCDWPVRITTQ